MASSSPASFKSQAHDISEDLRSQVPFHTQLPYDRSPFDVKNHQHFPSVPKPTSNRRPRSRETSTEILDFQPSRLKSDELGETGFSGAQQRHQSHSCRGDASEQLPPATVSRAVRIEDEDEDEGEAASSDESIECEPLGTNPGPLTAGSSVDPYPVDVAKSKRQPFPLVEWIRRIREESRPERPTLPLRWSKSIPKRQRTILDADDAWYPPLPGRPIREGTIPIDILTALTHQADQDAERKANKKSQPSDQGPSRSSERQTGVSQPQNLPSGPSSPTSVRDADVLWSSSPPSPRRRLLPPDTSPPRPASKEGQFSATAIKSLRRDNQSMPVNSKDGLNASRKTTHSPPNDSGQIEQTQNKLSALQEKGMEDGNACGVSRIVGASVPSQEMSMTSPLSEDLPANISGRTTRLLETITRHRPKIQVKDTPYPFKGLPQDRGRCQASDYLPQSSLVVGTYPDAANLDRRLENPPQPESSPVHQPSAARVTAPQTSNQSVSAIAQRPERPLKRTFEKVNQQAHPLVAGSVSPRDHRKSTASTNTDDGPPGRLLDEADTRTKRKQPRNEATLSPSSSEYKAEEELRVRNKERLVVEGIESRRAFRAPRSTSIIIDGVKYVPLQTSETVCRNTKAITIGGIVFVPALYPKTKDKINKAISAAPSSPKSHGPTAAGSRSEGDDTSATNLSLHETSRPTKPPSRIVSRCTSVHVTVYAGELEEMFRSFMRAYPDYLGSLKNFESALRFLLNLRSKPHEPHPSLWDDFVFRMADDYKVYLQECISEAESALPYQDFYYARIRQSKRRGGVITEDGLKIATFSTTQASTPLKRSSSNLLSHDDDVVMIDAHTPNTQLLRSHAKLSNASNVQELQSSHDPRVSTRAAPTSAIPKPDKVLSVEPITERGNTDKVRKRHSVPWSSNKSFPDRISLQTQQVETLAPSGKQNNVTKIVEQWLRRPAGARSPEIGLTQIQTPEQEIATAPSFDTNLPKTTKKKAADSSLLQDSDLSRLRLPSYLASPKDAPVKNMDNNSPDPLPSITASDIASQVERPVTLFTLFARDFANLQSEKTFRSLPASKRRLPINIYEW